MQDTVQYKCPSCGAALRFNASSGKLHCDSCGNDFDIEAAEAAARADSRESKEFDWSDYKRDFGEENLEGTVVYTCQSCGAEIFADAVTAATKCPYCDNNVVINENLKGNLKPNAIIPFKIDKKEIPGLIREFCKKKPLLPRGFFSENVLGKIQGVYVPFWLFNATMDGEMSLNATRVLYYPMGQYDVTETQHYLLEREGSIGFERVPADGSIRMDNDLMDSIEPFDYSELTEYDGRYLSGFVADRFDSSPDDELPRATERMMNSAVDAVKSSSGIYATVTMRSNNMDMKNASVKYVLLPVYLLNCTYRGKAYRYAINGQTGKVAGELPISRLKTLLYSLLGFAAAFAVVFGLTAILLR